jgi:hypothetical protein
MISVRLKIQNGNFKMKGLCEMLLISIFPLIDKADKRAERMRHEKQEQERQDREDELREMAIKLRRR